MRALYDVYVKYENGVVVSARAVFNGNGAPGPDYTVLRTAISRDEANAELTKYGSKTA